MAQGNYKRKLSTQEWDEVELLYSKGFPLRDIAEQFNITHAAINKKAKKENWERLSNEKIALKAGNLITKNLAQDYLPNDKKISHETIIDATAKAIADLTQNHTHTLKKQRKLLNDFLQELEQNIENLNLNDKMRLLKLATDSTRTIIELERRILNVDKTDTTPNTQDNNFTIAFV